MGGSSSTTSARKPSPESSPIPAIVEGPTSTGQPCQPEPVRIRSDQHHCFDVSPGELWAAMERVDQYRTWWPWLRHLDASILADEEVWAALVRPPLPYRLRFDLRLHSVEAPHGVSADVSGDIVGTARIEITPTMAGCSLHVVSDLAPANGVLRSVMRMAPRVARFGHDWVLTTGLRQFKDRALP